LSWSRVWRRRSGSACRAYSQPWPSLLPIMKKRAGRPPTMAARQGGAVKGDPLLRAPPDAAGYRNLRRENVLRFRHVCFPHQHHPRFLLCFPMTRSTIGRIDPGRWKEPGPRPHSPSMRPRHQMILSIPCTAVRRPTGDRKGNRLAGSRRQNQNGFPARRGLSTDRTGVPAESLTSGDA
jgi:hypothetical protein